MLHLRETKQTRSSFSVLLFCQVLSLAHGAVGSVNAINIFITTFSLIVSLKKDIGVFNFDFFFYIQEVLLKSLPYIITSES